ncbi:MAG: cadherin-like domain-containing protein, partial [Rhodothermales bacterium]
TAVEITLTGSDPEGVGLSFDIETQPTRGSLGTINVVDATSATVTYTPDANFEGSDSFTYSVSDGSASADGTVTLTITAVNDAPGSSDIVTPDDGNVLTIGGETREGAVGGSTVLFTADWQPVSDPEGSQVTYMYQVASDAAFDNVIDQRSLGTQTSADVTVAEAASWFDTIHGSSELGASTTIFHRVVASDGTLSSTGTGSSVVLVRGTVTGREEAGELPGEFTLQGNYPNPFNPSTVIRFDLPAPAEVTVEVTDTAGRRVMFIPGRSYGAGAGHSVEINASTLVSGTYLYRIIASFGDRTVVRSRSMTLLR